MHTTNTRLELSRTESEDLSVLAAVRRGFSIRQSFGNIPLTDEEREIVNHIDAADAYEEYDVPRLSFSRTEAALMKAALETAMEHQHGFGGRGLLRDPRAIGSMDELRINPEHVSRSLPILSEFIAV